MRAGIFNVLPLSERALAADVARSGEYRLLPLSARGDMGSRLDGSWFSSPTTANATSSAPRSDVRGAARSVIAAAVSAAVSATASLVEAPRDEETGTAAGVLAQPPEQSSCDGASVGTGAGERRPGMAQGDVAGVQGRRHGDHSERRLVDSSVTPVRLSSSQDQNCELGADTSASAANVDAALPKLAAMEEAALPLETQLPDYGDRAPTLALPSRRSLAHNSLTNTLQDQAVRTGDGRRLSVLQSSPRPDKDSLDAQARSLLLIGGGVLVLNLYILVIVQPVFKNPNTGDVQSWQPYIVLNGVLSSILLLARGLPADLLLLGLSAAFCTLRIISCDELLGGLSNEGVVAVAALCAVSASIDKTKALNGPMSKCLGMPHGTAMGILRMAIPLITLGSVFNNTPLVAVFIPIVKDWTARAGLDVGHFMMPLSFFAMLSATLTTMGSSTNLLAVKLVPDADIDFLDPAPVGVFIILTGVLYCIAMAPFLLPNAPKQEAEDKCESSCDAEALAGLPRADRYIVHFKVGNAGPLLGQSAKGSGLICSLKSPATVRCTVGDGSKDLEPGERLEVAEASAEEIMSLAVIPGLHLQAFLAWHKAQAPDGSPRYQKSPGALWKRAKQVQLALRFGGKREGAPPYTSESDNFESGITQVGRLAMPVRRWVAAGMGGGWDDPAHTLCKLVVPTGGLRGREGISASSLGVYLTIKELQQYLAEFRCTLVSMCGVSPEYDANCSAGRVTLQGGEVLLVEVSSPSVADKLRRSFALVLTIPEVAPPTCIIMSPLDPYRPLLAVMGLLFTVFFAALEIAPLDAVAILVALSSLLLGTLTGVDLYRSINGPVLLTVAASFGAGAAIYNTGLATCLASGVLFLAERGGPSAIMGALVGLALTLGIFVSNNTVVILLAPLIRDICERRQISLKMAMLAVIYAANLSFATPFSYQTNMMVMPHGHYVFTDYLKFGLPMMILCGIVALIGVQVYWA